MGPGFDYFVIFAEMRTGSNFLEENINAIPGLHCWGEAFNPHFVGHAGRDIMAGVSKPERERCPERLIEAMRKETRGLAGFRFFHDHDPRVLDLALDNPRCAKVVLTRNPLDSYVSLKIAKATGQWRLGDMKNAKAASITFDTKEFRNTLDARQGFQIDLMRRLQTGGQTAFYVDYEDIQDIAVLNGLARFLGSDGTLDRPVRKTKVQNPVSLEEKVDNFAEMERALSSMDFFGLGRTPNFEPRRGPNVPSYIAAARAPILFMPVPCGPEEQVTHWLADIDGARVEDLTIGRSQKDLRKWLRQNRPHRSVTVLRHPVDRLHEAFCRYILPAEGGYTLLRATLVADYKLPIPDDGPGAGYDARAHRAAFLAFAQFVKGNLGGQTGVRVDKAWATQWAIVQGMTGFTMPDHVIREEELDRGLARVADSLALKSPALTPRTSRAPIPLEAIYDKQVESAVRDIYQRDYMFFGFRDWR